MYNWQLQSWPDFTFDLHEVEADLFAFAEETGHITGILKGLSEDSRMDFVISTLVAEAIKTSEIEGEYFSREDMISSIRNKLGLNKTPDVVKDKKAEGAAGLVLAVRNTYAAPLTAQLLFEWHTLLMQESRHINIGVWRSGEEPMQIISGALGRETVHFEAPPASLVPEEMERFIQWFNDTAPGGKAAMIKAPVRAAIAHLYFESIHPFEDGNGRIGRAVADKALSQTTGRPLLISLSRAIESNKADYYSALKQAQSSNEITPWINYFVRTILSAQLQTTDLIDFSLRTAKLFDRYAKGLSDRQLKVISKMVDAGPDGFEGGMTAKKYRSITKVSEATATRDLQQLTEWGVFEQQGGGRNIRYILTI